MTLNGAAAWEIVRRNARFRWGHDPDAFTSLIYPAAYTPKFKVGLGHRVFCIGSCFARNIEEHLIYRGVDVQSKRLCNPRREWTARPNGLMNKFTTHSMLNELRWVENPAPAEPGHYTAAEEGWLDLQLSPGAKPVPLERAMERRAYLSADYFPRLAACDVVILTLGLNEAWKDEGTGLHLNAAPPIKSARAEPERYSIVLTTAEDNVEALEEIRQRVLRLRPSAKFVVTVSPVPLDISFTGEDPVIANTRSKAVLRAAAAVFCSRHADVDYFPSYEMVTMAPRKLAYTADNRHVTDAAVGAVIASFLAAHELPAEAPDFNEMSYLEANPDVDLAVRQGEMSSGFHHWRKWGRAAGRPLRPDEPTQLMKKLGIV